MRIQIQDDINRERSYGILFLVAIAGQNGAAVVHSSELKSGVGLSQETIYHHNK
jgi:hypothetical protein